MKYLNETYNNDANLLNNILNNDLVKYIQPAVKDPIFNIYTIEDNAKYQGILNYILNEYLRIYSIYNNVLLRNSDIFKHSDDSNITNSKIFDIIIKNKFIPEVDSIFRHGYYISEKDLVLCYKRVNKQVKKLYSIIKQYSTGNFTTTIYQYNGNSIDTMLYPFQVLETLTAAELNNISIQEYTQDEFVNETDSSIISTDTLIITFDKENNILQSGLHEPHGSCVAEYNKNYIYEYIKSLQDAVTNILNNFKSYITYQKWANIEFPIIKASLITDFYKAIKNVETHRYMVKSVITDNIYKDFVDQYTFDKIYVITNILSQMTNRQVLSKHKSIYSPKINNIFKQDKSTLLSNRYKIPYYIKDIYNDLITLFQKKSDPDTSTMFLLKTKFISDFLMSSQLKIIDLKDDKFDFNNSLKNGSLIQKLYKIYQFIQNEYQNILKIGDHKQAQNYLNQCEKRLDLLNKFLYP